MLVQSVEYVHPNSAAQFYVKLWEYTEEIIKLSN